MSTLKPDLDKEAPSQLKNIPPIVTSGMPGMMAGRRGVPLSVPLPFLLTGVSAAALFGLLLRELVHERWAWGSWWLINIGLACALFSALFMWILPLQIASGLLGAGFVLAAINIFGVVRHLFI